MPHLPWASRTPVSPSITQVQSSSFNVEYSDLLNMLSIIDITTAHGLIHPQPQFVFVRNSCRNLIVTHPTPCSCRANVSRLTLDLTLQQSTSMSLLYRTKILGCVFPVGPTSLPTNFNFICALYPIGMYSHPVPFHPFPLRLCPPSFTR